MTPAGPHGGDGRGAPRTLARLGWGLLRLLRGRLAAGHCQLRAALRRRAEAQARQHLHTSCRHAARIFIHLNGLATAPSPAAGGPAANPAGRVAHGLQQLVAQYVVRPGRDGHAPAAAPAAEMLAGLVSHLPGDCRHLGFEALLRLVARQPLTPDAGLPLPSPPLEAAAAAVLVRALRLACPREAIARFYARVEHDRDWDGLTVLAELAEAERDMVAHTLG